MTAVMALLNTIRKLPDWAWGVVVFAALAGGGWWLHTRSVELAVITDRREQADRARIERDSLLGAERLKAQWLVEQAEARTRDAWAARDKAVARTRQLEQQLATSQQRLADALVKLPDDVRRIPAVDSLVRACTSLAHDCEQLRTQIVLERAAVDTAKAATERERMARVAQQTVADSAIAKSAAVIATEKAKNAKLTGRISKTAAVVGFLIVRAAEEGVRALLRARQLHGGTP